MSAPVETKVKAASSIAAVAAFVVAYVVTSVPALAGMADLIQALVIALLTSASAAVGGWLASHTPRSDPAAIRARR